MISPRLRLGTGSDAGSVLGASFELGVVPAPPGELGLDPSCC